MSGHTPGTWHVVGKDGWLYVYAGDTEIAEIYYPPEDRGLANACLIAAAPEMLDALEEIAGEYHSDTCSFALLGKSHACDCHKAMANAAIAKAKGDAEGTND